MPINPRQVFIHDIGILAQDTMNILRWNVYFEFMLKARAGNYTFTTYIYRIVRTFRYYCVLAILHENCSATCKDWRRGLGMFPVSSQSMKFIQQNAGRGHSINLSVSKIITVVINTCTFTIHKALVTRFHPCTGTAYKTSHMQHTTNTLHKYQLQTLIAASSWILHYRTLTAASSWILHYRTLTTASSLILHYRTLTATYLSVQRRHNHQLWISIDTKLATSRSNGVFEITTIWISDWKVDRSGIRWYERSYKSIRCEQKRASEYDVITKWR